MIINKNARRRWLPYAVGCLALLTLLYRQVLYPLGLQPVGVSHALETIAWQKSAEPMCQAGVCRWRAGAQPGRAIAWIESRGAGHFMLDYALGIASDATPSGVATGGRIALFPESQGRLRWDVPHLFFDVSEAGQWRGRALLHFRPPADRYQLSVEWRTPYSTLEVSQWRLREYRETWVSSLMFSVLAIAWLVLAVFGGLALIAGGGRGRGSLLAVFLLLLVGTQWPNEAFQPLRQLLAPKAQSPVAEAIASPPAMRQDHADGGQRLAGMKKLAHGLLFAMLAGLLWRRTKPPAFLPVLLTLACLALATEAAQALTLTRTPSVVDWGIDMLGAVLALWLLSWRRR